MNGSHFVTLYLEYQKSRKTITSLRKIMIKRYFINVISYVDVCRFFTLVRNRCASVFLSIHEMHGIFLKEDNMAEPFWKFN